MWQVVELDKPYRFATCENQINTLIYRSAHLSHWMSTLCFCETNWSLNFHNQIIFILYLVLSLSVWLMLTWYLVMWYSTFIGILTQFYDKIQIKLISWNYLIILTLWTTMSIDKTVQQSCCFPRIMKRC